MSASIARVVEISATSDTSFEEAVAQGMDRAQSTLRNVASGWVKDQRVRVMDGKLSYQVNLQVTFVLDEDQNVT